MACRLELVRADEGGSPERRTARSILIAVHQANVTGNYTVLRDLGASGFHDRNPAADLAETMRRRTPSG